MGEKLKVFVGAMTDDETGEVAYGDNEELREMGRQAQKKGALVTHSLRQTLKEIRQIRPQKAVIEGGYADVCIPAAIQELLDVGAEEVVVNLKNVRSGHWDSAKKNDFMGIESRRSIILDKLGELSEDHRIKMVPPKRF